MVEILEKMVYMVNSGGTEMGITILVRGRVITGLLTPNQRFHAWMVRMVNEASKSSAGRAERLVLDEPAISKEEAEAVKQDWLAFQGNAFDSVSSSVSDFLQHAHVNFCLRNASIWGSSPLGSPVLVRAAYLMLDLASVEGFTLGILSYGSSPKKADGEE